MRFFFSENANRPIHANGKLYEFGLIGTRAGTMIGVLTMADSEADQFLAVAAPFGVREIPEEEYLARIQKKKTMTGRVSPHSPPSPKPVVLQSKAGVVVVGAAAVAKEAPPETADELLEIGAVGEETPVYLPPVVPKKERR